MVPAYFKEKLIVENNRLKTNEDFKTSCSIGLLQYLPDAIFKEIIQECCRNIEDFGQIQAFNFWEHTNASFTSNERFVEPDVWIETDNYDVIIEAKFDDNAGQYKDQWEKEIQSIKNEQNNRNIHKKIALIALGGNDTLQDEEIKQIPISKLSWLSLLTAIVNKRQEYNCETHICRLLDDIISLFALQGIIKIKWFDSMQIAKSLDANSIQHWITPSNIELRVSKELFINENAIKKWVPIN